MIGVQNKIIDIKKYGCAAHVPQSPMARIMYYLNCVNSITDFKIPYELKNYHNYESLSFDQENEVLCLAVLLNPTLFILNGIMVYNPNLKRTNTFYEIKNSTVAFAFTREFAIANQKVHPLKIMEYKNCWLEKHYIDPMKVYSKRISAIANGTVERMRPQCLTYGASSRNSTATTNNITRSNASPKINNTKTNNTYSRKNTTTSKATTRNNAIARSNTLTRNNTATGNIRSPRNNTISRYSPVSNANGCFIC